MALATLCLVFLFLQSSTVVHGIPASDLTPASGMQLDGIDLSEILEKILKQFDPFTVSRYDFNLHEKDFTLEGYIQDLVITGISGLKLNTLSVVIVDGKASVDILLPSISYKGQYSVGGSLSLVGLSVPVVGAGVLSGGFDEFVVDLSVELGISKDGHILLDDFQINNWNMSDIRVKIGGLYNNYPLGNIVNEILDDALAHVVLKVYHDLITETIMSLVTDQGAAFLLGLHKDRETQAHLGWKDAENILEHNVPLLTEKDRPHSRATLLRRIKDALELAHEDADEALDPHTETHVEVQIPQVSSDSEEELATLMSLIGHLGQGEQDSVRSWLLQTNSKAMKVAVDGTPLFLPPGSLSANDLPEFEDTILREGNDKVERRASDGAAARPTLLAGGQLVEQQSEQDQDDDSDGNAVPRDGVEESYDSEEIDDSDEAGYED